MIAGINKVFLLEGREFHIQAEDLGLDKACFEIKVYEKGVVLWLKRLPYTKVLEQELPILERNQALKALIDKSIMTIEAAIARGRFG